MKAIPSQRLKPAYYEPIEDQIQLMLYEILFYPLVSILETSNSQLSLVAHGMLNAADNPLQVALRIGRIQYEAGMFSGDFNAATSRVLKAIGAKFDLHQKVFKLAPSEVPGWVKAEAAAYQMTARGAHESMVRKLSETQSLLDQVLDKKEIHAKRTIRAIQSDFKDVAQLISVKPELSEDSAAKLAADYNTNLKLYIRDFSNQMIGDLRAVVEKNATAGYRFDKLLDAFKTKYGVTQNKAKFLARQETALFMSKYRRQRFGEAGVTHYKWSTSHDERVRPSAGTHGTARQDNHRILDGRVFAYADPPVVDTATGRRANPGEDYNCRCVDIPVLERLTVSA